MSTIISKKIKNYKLNAEVFNSAAECVRLCREREITDSSFSNMQDGDLGGHTSSWCGGIKTYDEALELLHSGYQPTVDSMRGVFNAKVSGDGKRFTFQNGVAGFAPIVPLALIGVPNSMIDMRIKTIKAKVIDIYIDMTCSAGTDSDDIKKASQKVLESVIELEKQGYRFNIFVGSGYCNSSGGDFLSVKVKSAEQPLDLKRVSFPMTHTGFLRVIGFDWYSKFPLGTYRGGYGHAPWHEFHENTKDVYRELFGKKNIVFFAIQQLVISGSKESIIKEVLENNGKCKN